ncbi:hypothetical protein MHYP_G00061550 [Metynnis hypsauchen]
MKNRRQKRRRRRAAWIYTGVKRSQAPDVRSPGGLLGSAPVECDGQECKGQAGGGMDWALGTMSPAML